MSQFLSIIATAVIAAGCQAAPPRPPVVTVYIALTDSPASKQIRRALESDYDCGLLDSLKAELVRDISPRLLFNPDHWEHGPSLAVGRYGGWQRLPDVEQCEAAMWLLFLESVRDQLFADYRRDFVRWETCGECQYESPELLAEIEPQPPVVLMWGFTVSLNAQP